jgi:hypothetical protein
MTDVAGRLRRWLVGLPSKMARGVPWAHVEPAGLGVGPTDAGDVREREAHRRTAREVWRSTNEGSRDGDGEA